MNCLFVKMIVCAPAANEHSHTHQQSVRNQYCDDPGDIVHCCEPSSDFFGVVRSIEFDRRAARFVGVQDAEWWRVNMNGDEVAIADVGISQLMNIRNS